MVVMVGLTPVLLNVALVAILEASQNAFSRACFDSPALNFLRKLCNTDYNLTKQ